MKDERIEQAKLKIRSEMAIIILFGVAVSYLVKTLVFKMSLQESIIEYLILIFFPLYQFIRMHMLKVSIYSEHGKKSSIKNLFVPKGPSYNTRDKRLSIQVEEHPLGNRFVMLFGY